MNEIVFQITFDDDAAAELFDASIEDHVKDCAPGGGYTITRFLTATEITTDAHFSRNAHPSHNPEDQQ